ncbi:MAG TPA: methionyl-tRNA formyltransferase, partial [Thermomicrobiales bacterium]|nr:methionyl-tRNA formyltransferase [Thermomicrobiales bacterium]
ADLFVVAAFGRIFSQAILSMPRYGCVNLHASLLPAYRGAAPIPAAILSGDEMTGVTLMVMERGLDTGPILATATLRIDRSATTESLTGQLAELGAGLTTMALPHIVGGEIGPVNQGPGATIVRQLTKADGQIDWSLPALQIERHIRAMWAWPRAWSVLDGTVLTVQIHAVSIEPVRPNRAPGEILVESGTLLVGTGNGLIRIDRAQLPGGKPLSGADLIRNGSIVAGNRFALPGAPEVPLIQPA